MSNKRIWRQAWLSVCLALGCTAQDVGIGDVALASSALSACDETVPANRFVDGIPAYSQCGASLNSQIFSNDGVQTSATSLGPDWVRTQWNNGYQCTEIANRYLHFLFGVDWMPNGNAGTWCDKPPPDWTGVVQTDVPVHGDLIVLAPGSCGADGFTGHVAVVDVVQPSGMLSVVEQNPARRGAYLTSCAKCFLHALANDGGLAGAGGSAGGPPVGGAAGMADGGAGMSGSGGMSGNGGSTPPPPVADAGMQNPLPAGAPAPTPVPAGAAAPIPMPPPLGTAGTLEGAGFQRASPPEGGCSIARAGGSNAGFGGSWLLACACAASILRIRRRSRPSTVVTT